MSRNQRNYRQGDPKHRTPSGPPMRDRRRGGSSGPPKRGPKSCPMCGAIVPDLNLHIRTKHDDAASHPRE